MFNYQTFFSNPVLFVVGFLALIISIGIHEFAHVFSAYLQGDQTGKMMGRLTLNPIKHLDPLGTAAIIFIGLGWGKPAPFNPYALRFRRWGSALVAVAGPISNLIMVGLAGAIFAVVGSSLDPGNLLRIFLTTLIILNAALAVFNLIPVHPLDGSHLLEAVLGADNRLSSVLRMYGPFILIAILLFPGSPIGSIIGSGIELILQIFGLHGIL